jgi:hypothetical protein
MWEHKRLSAETTLPFPLQKARAILMSPIVPLGVQTSDVKHCPFMRGRLVELSVKRSALSKDIPTVRPAIARRPFHAFDIATERT